MYYVIDLTEGCNLQCAYCDAKESRGRFDRDVTYKVSELATFLNQDPDLALQFYGGEPLLKPKLMTELLALTHPKHVVVQTNGLLLERIPTELLPKIDVVAISLDGPPEVTNRARGPNVYEKAIAQAHGLRQRGYHGRVDVRMTISPGMRILEAVEHFVHHQGFAFNCIYWQLNVEFHASDWRLDRHFLTRWFADSYNPQISTLIERWVQALETHGRLHGIVPFAALCHDIITGQRPSGIRCGAGDSMWTITTDGHLFPCPVMRGGPHNVAGQITQNTPATLEKRWPVQSPCTECEVLGLCGGRCLCTHEQRRWGEGGHTLVCNSVKHLIRELTHVAPRVQRALERHHLPVGALDLGLDYEVIP